MVLEVLPQIEKRSRILPVGGPVSLDVTNREAINPKRPIAPWSIPGEAAHPNVGQGSYAEEAVTSAALIRISKFSTPSCVRATALYWESTPAVSVRVVIGQGCKQLAVRPAIKARSVLGDSTMLHAPALFDHGSGRRFAFLVEQLVFGDHPRSVSEKLAAGSEVIDRLMSAHSTIGVKHRIPLAHPDTRQRLQALFENVLPSPGLPRLDEILDAAGKLVETRSTVPTGWIHGDLVFSNLIADPFGHLHLIDWEHAAVRPVIADLAKLAAAMPGPDGVAQVLDQGSSLEAPVGGLSIRDQLARFYLQEISWWERKHQRAIEAHRLEAFESWANRRFGLLGPLLER